MKSSAEERPERNDRSEQRDSCEINASIYFLPKTRIQCVIKDMSPRGAKIRVDARIKLPRHIFLMIPDDSGSVDARHCELRWRIAGVAGLRFVFLSPEMLALFKDKPAR